MYKLNKQDPENFTPERVDGEILNKMVGKAHDSAVESLGGYLFEEEYRTPQEELLERISEIKNLDPEAQKNLLKEIEEAVELIKHKKG